MLDKLNHTGGTSLGTGLILYKLEIISLFYKLERTLRLTITAFSLGDILKEPGLQIKNVNTGMRISGTFPLNLDISSHQRPFDPILNTFIEILCRPDLAEHLQIFFMQQIDKITSGCPDPNARLYLDYLSQHPEQLDKLPALNINNEHVGVDLTRNRDSIQNQDNNKNTSFLELPESSQQSSIEIKPLYHHYLEFFPPSVSRKTHITSSYPPITLTPASSSSSNSHPEVKSKKWHILAGLLRRGPKQEASANTSLRSLLQKKYIKKAKIERLLYREPDYPPLSLETNYLHLTIVDHAYQKKSEQQLLSDRTSRDFNNNHEKRFHTDKDIQIEDLFTPQEGETVIPHRVLLIGPAGSGKSIFCRYALYRWAQEKLWQKDYSLVVWFPLRKLATQLDPYPTSIAEFIKHLYKIPWTVAEIEKELQHYAREEKLLYVLDGLDEVSYLLAQQSSAQRLLELLLKQPDVLITTRPHQVRELVKGNPRMVENLGFRDEHIEKYVQQFFLSLEQLEQVAPCLQWLKSNPYLWGTAHVPINAELLCSLWEHAQRSGGHLASVSLTMTDIYTRIVEMLLDRQRSKGEGNQSIQRLKTWMPHELYGYYQQELNLLKVLGLYGLEEHRIVLEASRLNTFIEGSKLSQPVRNSLEQLGLLKPVDPSLQPQDQEVYFIHLTFQEFFAAQFIVQALTINSNFDLHQAVLAFITRYRYHPQYQVVWRFVVGLLCQLDSKQLGKTRHFEYFLDQLVQAPRDQVGLYDSLLLLQCLEEGKLALTSEKLGEYITYFFQWFTFYIETFVQTQCSFSSELSSFETLYLPFLPVLTSTLVGCPRLTTHGHFRASLKKLAEKTFSFMNQLIFHLLQQIKIHDIEDLLLVVTLYQALDNITKQPFLSDEKSIIYYLVERMDYAKKENLAASLKLIDQVFLCIHPKYEAFTQALVELINNQLFYFQEELIRIICIIRPVSEDVQELLAVKPYSSSKASPQENNFSALEQLKINYPELNKNSLMALTKQVEKKTCSDALVSQWIDWQLARDHQQIIIIIQQGLIHLKIKEIQKIIKECEGTCFEIIDSSGKGNKFLAPLSIYHQRVLEYILDNVNNRDKFIAFFLDQMGLKKNILSSRKFTILKNSLLEASRQLVKSAQQRKDYQREVRLVVVGSGCGKTALIERFIYEKFVEKCEFTIEDEYNKLINVDGHACKLDVIDTGGTEGYSNIRDQASQQFDQRVSSC